MRERSLESPDSSEECERRERCKKVEQSGKEEGHFHADSDPPKSSDPLVVL